MANIKAVIVDEERLARVNLRRLLRQFPEIEIAGEADFSDNKQYHVQEMTSIHLHSNMGGEFAPNSDIKSIYILSTIAFLIFSQNNGFSNSFINCKLAELEGCKQESCGCP